MSFTQPEPASESRAVKGMAWAVVAIGAMLLLFLGWYQVTMIQESRSYGIQRSWLSLLPFFLPLGALIAGAAYAARRGRYRPALGLGAVAVGVLGLVALLTVGGVGM
jgi:cytochrome bd-type quinol oxidase subunit 2